MNTEQKNPNPKSEHEKKNEGGREFGHVHDPTQAQQASKNQGLSGNQPQQQQSARPQQGGSGSTQSSQQSKPPGNTGQEKKKPRQDESKSA